MGGVTPERPVGLLVVEVKETCPVVLWVGFKVKKIVDLVGRRFCPFVKFIQDIECSQHPISIWSYLEGGDTKVIGHPHKKGMKREISSRLNMVLGPGAVRPSWAVSPLVLSGTCNGYPSKGEFFEAVGNHSRGHRTSWGGIPLDIRRILMTRTSPCLDIRVRNKIFSTTGRGNPSLRVRLGWRI